MVIVDAIPSDPTDTRAASSPSGSDSGVSSTTSPDPLTSRIPNDAPGEVWEANAGPVRRCRERPRERLAIDVALILEPSPCLGEHRAELRTASRPPVR